MINKGIGIVSVFDQETGKNKNKLSDWNTGYPDTLATQKSTKPSFNVGPSLACLGSAIQCLNDGFWIISLLTKGKKGQSWAKGYLVSLVCRVDFGHKISSENLTKSRKTRHDTFKLFLENTI